MPSRAIGYVEKTFAGQTTRHDILYADGYGVICPGVMTTNGDARWIADLAQQKEKLIERHRREGMEWDMSVKIGDVEIGGMTYADAMAIIAKAAPVGWWSDTNFGLMRLAGESA